MKKTVLSIGSTITIATPIVAVVSCGVGATEDSIRIITTSGDRIVLMKDAIANAVVETNQITIINQSGTRQYFTDRIMNLSASHPNIISRSEFIKLKIWIEEAIL